VGRLTRFIVTDVIPLCAGIVIVVWERLVDAVRNIGAGRHQDLGRRDDKG
jgi:hypothetical protein